MSTFKQVTTRDGKTITISTVRPEIDWNLLADSITELIILHMEGKKGHDQVIFDDVVRQLKYPHVRRRAETMFHHAQIVAAIQNLVDEIYSV